MGTVTPIDDYKKKEKKEERKKVLNPTNRHLPGSSFFEQNDAERNRSIGYDVKLDQDVAKGALNILIERPDVSEINQQGTNNQKQVLRQIQKDLEAGRYFAAVGRIIREDIQLTNRTLWSFLRLNRAYQGQRTGTTDVMEMPEVRNDFSKEEIKAELMSTFKGPEKNKPAVEMALLTVANGKSGTTEVGLDDLELAHQLVRNVLKAELKNKYEDIFSLEGNQHGLSGMEMPGVKDMSPLQGSFSNNEKINKYLRLYEVLTIELFDKQKHTEEKNITLKFEKAAAVGLLDKLSSLPGIAVSQEMREQFKNKISQMQGVVQLKFFELKILDLINGINQGEKNKDEADAEILRWLDPSVKFSPEELRKDLAERKLLNKSEDNKQIENLRKGNVVTMPIHKPVKPLEKAA